MSYAVDITNEKRSATKGAVCRTESENQTAHALACDNQFGPIDLDMINHRNERRRSPQKNHSEPNPEPDYEVEGMRPHN